MSTKQTIFVGDRFNTKYGICEVIEYNNCENILVKFPTGGITKTNSTDLRRDCVKDWNFPIVENKGYFGYGEYKARIKNKITPQYSCLQSMLKRCYNEIILAKEPSYLNCTVCDEWLCYQNFGKWFDSITYKQTNWQLDKDLLFPGNKIYSPDKCCFIPSELNKALAINKINNKTLPIGVREKEGKFIVSFNKYGKNTYIGIYDSLKEAKNNYKSNKLNYLLEICNNYKVPEFIINSINNFINLL